MAEMQKNWLEYLQTLPEPSKKRVLVIATAIVMAIVIYFWLAYFNNMVASISQSSAPAAENAPAVEAPASAASAAPAALSIPAVPGASIGERVQNAFGSLSGWLAGIAGSAKNIVNATGQYDVQPK